MKWRSQVIVSLITVMLVISMTGLAVSAQPDGTRADADSSDSLLFADGDDSSSTETLTTDGRMLWKHLTSKNGDIPDPGTPSHTSALVFDVDNNGIDDIIIGSRGGAPAVTWFRPVEDGWERYIIDEDPLSLEAGGAFYDITGNGALDFVIGEDITGNKVYWWENPYPDYDPEVPWTRRIIKDSGANKHHDQIFADFTGDGRAELVFWNQGASKLLLAEIPEDPREVEPWPIHEIFSYTGNEMEGLASADINGDGIVNIVGGGRWYEHTGDYNFTPHIIDDELRYGTAAAGDLTGSGAPEVVFSAADHVGPIRWYELIDGDWISHELLDRDIVNGHSLDIVDIDDDGHLDIFAAEMRHDGTNEEAKMWIFYGDGTGDFEKAEVSIGIGNHESKIGDLNGNGRLDILGKPYNWDTPRLDVWLNQGPVADAELPLDLWERHEIDVDKPWRSLFITAADINGSGHQDIITGGWWYENPGVPGTSWTRHTIGSPLYGMASVYDFTGNGYPDILGTKGKGSESNAEFVWAENDGSGNFTIHDNIPTAQGTFLQGVAVDYFQNDQLGVALSWHDVGAGVQLLSVPNDPVSETWGWEQISEVSQGEDLSVGDIDGDGSLDLLLGTKWLRNDGDSWSAHTLFEADEPDRNFLADINGNGRLDAVVGYESSSDAVKLAWYEQGEVATDLWKEHVIAEIVGPMSLDVRDMNNNGALDVVVGEHNLSDPTSARMLVYENADGVGGAWIEHVVSVGDEHHMGAQVADMYSDGDLDIISIGWDHDRVLLYENRAVSTALNRHLRPVAPSIPPPDEGRVIVGLQALFPFNEGGGSTVHDVSGTGDPLDLQVSDSGSVNWSEGTLQLTSSTLVASEGPATKLIDAFQESNSLTIEAWVQPSSASQAGPARIITMSDGLQDRNLMIGHGNTQGGSAARFDSRLRTTTTNANGQPSLETDEGTATTELTHLVYTRTSAGTARVFLDGVEVSSAGVGGTFSNWNDSYRLGLGNEIGADRPWLGTYHLVAFYDRALSSLEVAHNFAEGPDAESGDPADPPGVVTWVTPSADAVISGAIELSVTAPEETERIEFSFIVDGDETEIGTVQSPSGDEQWSSNWDTQEVPDGSYQLRAAAFDADDGGELLAEATRQVTVRNDEASRISTGLVTLYEFLEGSGTTVQDTSGAESALNLEIENAGSASWGDGALTLTGSNRISTQGPATKIIEAAQASNEITVEAWITPAQASQSGPARIATISGGLFERNLTLGQGNPNGTSAARYDTRLRATSTDQNGQPSLSSAEGSASTDLQHVVYTRDPDGEARLYIDGQQVSNRTVSGSLNNWNSNFAFALGNELGADRPWLGTFHLVAIYDRALSGDEVFINFEAGEDSEPGGTDPVPVVSWLEPSAGAIVSGNVTLSVDAPEETERVEFAIVEGDQTNILGTVESGSESWSMEWDSTSVADGTHEITASAYASPGGDDLLAEAARSITVQNEEPEPVGDGIIALYDFSEGSGATVRDISGSATPLDLTIENPGAVTWGDGTLDLSTANRIVSTGAATGLISAVQETNELSIEAWITPKQTSQSGPARIATISSGLFDRNMTLGHGNPNGTAGTGYDVRVRTSETNSNGQPSLSSPGNSVKTELQHVVYTRASDGTVRIFIDGVEVSSGTIGGSFANWNSSYRFALGNEVGADRPWLGTYHRLAIFDRALTSSDVQAQFESGPDAETGPRVLWVEPAAGATLSNSATLRVDAPEETERVQFSYEEAGSIVEIGEASEPNPEGHWSIDWDTTAVDDGDYTLIAAAFDGESETALDEAARSIAVRNAEPERSADGLLALYEFAEGSGNVVSDTSGNGSAIDLEVADSDAVTWSDASLAINSPTIIASAGPVTTLIEPLQASNEITLEAWITPAQSTQSGPARIVTVSDGLHNRNFTMGQGGEHGFPGSRYEMRLRTTSTNANGQPSLFSPDGSATTLLQHVVYTRGSDGTARLYVDGILVGSTSLSGTFDNWNDGYSFALANELGGDGRPWLGTYHLVAIYDRALGQDEVQSHYAAGAD